MGNRAVMQSPTNSLCRSFDPDVSLRRVDILFPNPADTILPDTTGQISTILDAFGFTFRGPESRTTVAETLGVALQSETRLNDRDIALIQDQLVSVVEADESLVSPLIGIAVRCCGGVDATDVPSSNRTVTWQEIRLAHVDLDEMDLESWRPEDEGEPEISLSAIDSITLGLRYHAESPNAGLVCSLIISEETLRGSSPAELWTYCDSFLRRLGVSRLPEIVDERWATMREVGGATATISNHECAFHVYLPGTDLPEVSRDYPADGLDAPSKHLESLCIRPVGRVQIKAPERYAISEVCRRLRLPECAELIADILHLCESDDQPSPAMGAAIASLGGGTFTLSELQYLTADTGELRRSAELWLDQTRVGALSVEVTALNTVRWSVYLPIAIGEESALQRTQQEEASGIPWELLAALASEFS
jgi:hypothetical protein